VKPTEKQKKYKPSPAGVEQKKDMSSYRQILYHIVFGTKDRHKTLSLEHSRNLYAYIMGVIRNKNCFLYRINGMEDHIHILCDLHPTIALADYMRDIKTSSSIWLKETGDFPDFTGWASGYAALTYSWRDKDMIVNYIKNQQEHHKKETFEDEFRRLLKEHGIEIDEKYFL
jgi:REP element-mobilizing transposase RayT